MLRYMNEIVQQYILNSPETKDVGRVEKQNPIDWEATLFPHE